MKMKKMYIIKKLNNLDSVYLLQLTQNLLD